MLERRKHTYTHTNFCVHILLIDHTYFFLKYIIYNPLPPNTNTHLCPPTPTHTSTPPPHICTPPFLLTGLLPYLICISNQPFILHHALLFSLQYAGSNALLLASNRGHTEIVQALLAVLGIDVNHTNVGIYPLIPVPFSSWG